MKLSIVPEIISDKKMKFFDDKNVEITICNQSKFRYINPFKTPFIMVDTFAKKTSHPEKIVGIEIEELKNLKFMVTSIFAGKKKWRRNQKVIYRIESISNPTPGSKRLINIPVNHKVMKDVVNKKLRIIGPNAGYPRHGDGGPWILI